MTIDDPSAPDPKVERAELLHKMQRHSPEGVEADLATVRREMHLLIPLTIVGLIGRSVALRCIGGWLAVGCGAVVFFGHQVYGCGPHGSGVANGAGC